MCVVDFSAPAKPVIEVTVVGIAFGRRLRMNKALDSGIWIDPQRAWRGFRETRRPAVTGEVSPAKQFDQGVFAMALN